MTRTQNPLPYADPAPPLSRSERNTMLEEAYEAYAQLFTAIRIARGGSDPHATTLGGVSGKTTGTIMMCTTTTISGTLDDVAELYTASDSHFVLDFPESKRLYELESPTSENPLRCVGLRYSRWASISSLVSDRDFLYLEVMDEFVDKKTGHRGWARCTKSIVHHVCPPVQRANGPLRAQLFVMGMVVRETAKLGTLELITLIHADLKKHAPAWITRSVLNARQKNAMTLSHVLKVKRRVREGGSTDNGSTTGSGDFAGDPYKHSTTSTDETEQSKAPGITAREAKRMCKGCMDKVSRWTRSYKCRKCQEMICKNCATMTYIDTDTLELRNRICADCSFSANDDCRSSVDGGSSTNELDVLDSQRSINELWRAQEHYKSERSREKEKERERQRQRQFQHQTSRGDAEEIRNRAYSRLAVEDLSNRKMELPKVELYSPCDENEQNDLASTMRRLQQLNAGTAPTESETSREYPISRRPRELSSRGEDERKDHTRERKDHSRERKDPTQAENRTNPVSRAGPPVLQRTPSGGTSNHRTAAYIRGRKGLSSPDTRSARGLDRKASVSPEKVHVPRGPHEARASPKPTSADPTARSRSKSPGLPKVPSSPAVVSPPEPKPAAPALVYLTTPPVATPMSTIDLSYLQSFAKTSKPDFV